MKLSAIKERLVYCVDLAKREFQVHVYTERGALVKKARMQRKAFQSFLTDLSKTPKGTVVMEACGSAHFWARLARAQGHEVKLVPAQFVAQRRIGSKTDGNDADGIFAVHADPRVRPVPIKTLAQQDLMALHNQRELLVCQRTQCRNQIRGLLAERGVVQAQGERGLSLLLQTCHESAEVTADLQEVVADIVEHLRLIERQIERIERKLAVIAQKDEVARRVDSIHCVGVITATAVAAHYGNRLDRFANCRQFAASIGLAPGEHSSGEKRQLTGITKRGNEYLRKLLVQCAQVVLQNCQERSDPLSLLAQRLQGKRRNTIVIAIANRIARTIYAVIKRGENYRHHPVATTTA